jgi:hypothetical protein
MFLGCPSDLSTNDQRGTTPSAAAMRRLQVVIVATGKTNLVVICVDTLADRARVTKIKWRANF